MIDDVVLICGNAFVEGSRKDEKKTGPEEFSPGANCEVI